MTKIAFINIPAHGHTNPTLPLVAELIRRGEQVVYYSFAEFRPAIERTGAIFRSYQSAFAVDYTRPDQNLFRLATVLLQATHASIAHLLPLLQAERPDLIIYDSLCPWGKYLAQILGLPAICSTTTFAINARVALSSPAQALSFVRMGAGALPQMRQFRRLAGRLAATYGIERPGMTDMFRNTGKLNLVFTSAAFQPYAASFDDRFRFVGPSLNPQELTEPFPFPAVGDRPVVYIALGTLFNEQIGFYRLCFDAFSGAGLHVVLSVGNKTAISGLGAIPANFTVRNFVAQVTVLRHSRAFITHGGMNSVHEALYFGVPLVVVPQAADQEFVAQRVPAVGAGITLRKDRLRKEMLRGAVATILANASYAEASQRIGQSLRAAGGYPRAADEVQSFLHRAGAHLNLLDPTPATSAIIDQEE